MSRTNAPGRMACTKSVRSPTRICDFGHYVAAVREARLGLFAKTRGRRSAAQEQVGLLGEAETPDQVSIWSVARRDARTFFVIAGTLWVVAMMFIVYKSWDDLLPQASMPQAGWRRVGDFVLGVLTDFSPVGIAIATLSMILAPGANYTGDAAMTFYQAMVNKFVIPVIEAHKAEGREEGPDGSRGGGACVERATPCRRARGPAVRRAASGGQCARRPPAFLSGSHVDS